MSSSFIASSAGALCRRDPFEEDLLDGISGRPSWSLSEASVGLFCRRVFLRFELVSDITDEVLLLDPGMEQNLDGSRFR